MCPLTQLARLRATPAAMSDPLHWTEEALPQGVQFFAPFGAQGRPLSQAPQLHAWQPWLERFRPGLRNRHR